MHIGFVTSHYPFHDASSVGGIGTSIKNLGDELLKMGHRVSIFVYGQEADTISEDGQRTIYKIKNVKIKGLSWYFTRKKIQKIINSKQLDIVECPDWEGISSFINANCPLVIRLNGSDAYFCHLDKRPVKFKNKFQEKRALQRADGLISVSQFTADVTNEVFQLNRKFTIIPNGINLDLFSVNENSIPQQKTILYFGGIIRKKGVLEIPHYFNQVMNQIPDAKLIIIGKDMPDIISGNKSTSKMMQATFTEEALKNVTFLGSKPYTEIRNYISEASVCIFPSYAEAMPVSWLEAMALEKVIIGSDIGWSQEIIENGVNGFKVNPKDYATFAERIVTVLRDDRLKKQIEKEARKTIIKTFSTEITALKTIEFYKKIVSNK